MKFYSIKWVFRRQKAKTGAYSTSADVLEDLSANGVEIATKVLEWRHIAKLKSTYADALVESILPETGAFILHFPW